MGPGLRANATSVKGIVCGMPGHRSSRTGGRWDSSFLGGRGVQVLRAQGGRGSVHWKHLVSSYQSYCAAPW